MNLKQALKLLPAEEIISVGCENAPGWFYFSKVGEVDTQEIASIMEKKYSESLYSKRLNAKLIRANLTNPKYIQNCTMSRYISGWLRLDHYEKEIPYYEKKAAEFNHEALLKTEIKAYRKSDKTIGILLKDWKVAGSYWYLKEWEEKHGKI